MKTRVLSLLGGILISVGLSAQWITQDPGFTVPKEIKHIHAVDASVVWITAHAVSGQGTPSPVFSRTTDGGTTWTPGVITTEELNTAMIFALSDQVAFAPMYKSGAWTGQPGLFKTGDGGLTWTRQSGIYTDPTSFPDIVHFFDNNHGVTIGDPVDGYFEIYITSDGGDTWSRVSGENIPNPLTSEYATVDDYAFYANSIWIPTTEGRVLRSTDLGATWAVSTTPYPGMMFTAFYNQNQGVIMDHQSWYYTSLNETGDGGVSWLPVASTGPVLNWDITHVPGTVSTLVSTGVFGTNGLSFSINGGHDWHYAPESEGINFFHSDWFNNTTGWAGGFNDETGLAFIYKYNGPGLTDLIFSSMSLDFGEVDQGETASQTVTISNYGGNVINLFAIYTDNMDFYSNTPSAVLIPGQSVNVEVVFQPSYIGLAEGHLIVESDHPELSYIEIDLTGTGVDIPDISTNPPQFDVPLYSGEKQVHNLELINNLADDINYQANISLASSLSVLGWEYGSTPFGPEDGIFGGETDQAMFIKDVTIPAFTQAILYIGFDDGARFWVNGELIFDNIYEVHGVNYWEYELDISGWLHEGQNRIGAAVFNGVFGGGYPGGFDCQLTVDGIDYIKRGDQHEGEPEALWYYYGETEMTLIPPDDINNLNWWEFDYGKYNWITLARSTGQQFLLMGWNYWSTPVFENPDLLNASPDMAQFVKDIEVPEYSNATLYLGFDDGCRVWINGEMKFDYHYDDHGLDYWNATEDITGMLVPGRNRISVEVYNGIWGGAAWGAWDCQLEVDGVDLIKRGDQNPGAPEAMWYMHGQGGQQLIPPEDNEGLKWMQKDYGYFDQPPSLNLSGSIPIGESENLKVIFNAAGIPAGYYFTNIVLDYSYLEMQTQVPVTMNVTDGPHCVAIPEVIDLGEIFLEHTDSSSFIVQNTGSELLDIYDIYSLNYSVVVAPSWVSLEPGQSQKVMVYYSDFDDKFLVENIYIDSNDPVNPHKTVELIAYGINPPDLVIPNVDYMFASLPPDGFETQNLHLENWGWENSLLNFSLPQADDLKKPSGLVQSQLMPFLSSGLKGTIPAVKREMPLHYLKDIKSHKNLVIANNSIKAGTGEIEIFYDDMEEGNYNWAVQNFRMTASQWHLATFNSYSPMKSWWCGDETSGTYTNDSIVQEAIISPSILLPPVECNITLEFNESWEVEGMYDQCFVDISTDGGYNWDRIREGIPGSSGGWITTSLDISNYWNQTVKIRFLFDTGDDIANGFPGWFVDDVRIYFNDFDFLIISPEGGSIPGGQGFDISVSFDASGYGPGFYTGFVLILSNDPNIPQFYLPAYLEVTGSAELELKVALEGPYDFDGSVYMRTDLNPVLPLDQPFNAAPWNYTGTEVVPSIPNTDIVDWVLLEFRDAPDAQSATPATVVGRQAAFLRNNAMVVNLDGYSRLPVEYSISNQLFIVVWQRNHLGIMTADPVIPTGSLYNYDFTTGAEKAFGVNAQKNIGSGFYGMYSGDLDANGVINNTDITVTWKNQAGKSDYLMGDANMDRQVNNIDKNNYLLPNTGNGCQVPQ